MLWRSIRIAEAILIYSHDMVFYGELMIITKKNLYFLVYRKGFMGTEMFA